ncbi:MAG: hypothetical protein QX193_02385 [Methylococcales bacterium]
MGVWWCDEKQIPPQPPFKKGGEKAPIFLIKAVKIALENSKHENN